MLTDTPTTDAPPPKRGITDTQKKVLEMADYAIENNWDEIELVQDYFFEQDYHPSRADVIAYLARARQAEKADAVEHPCAGVIPKRHA